MRYLMHPSNMDICLLELIRDGKATYQWWNLGYVGRPYYVQEAIAPKGLENWIDITSLAHKKRNEPGVPK